MSILLAGRRRAPRRRPTRRSASPRASTVPARSPATGPRGRRVRLRRGPRGVAHSLAPARGEAPGALHRDRRSPGARAPRRRRAHARRHRDRPGPGDRHRRRKLRDAYADAAAGASSGGRRGDPRRRAPTCCGWTPTATGWATSSATWKAVDVDAPTSAGGRTDDLGLPAPERLWWLLLVGVVLAVVRVRPVPAAAGTPSGSRACTCSTRSPRSDRAGGATRSPRCFLARPHDRRDGRRAAGRRGPACPSSGPRSCWPSTPRCR